MAVWYPTVDDVIDANMIAVSLTGDSHPHRLRRSRDSIEAAIGRVKNEENHGLICQAAVLVQELVKLHAFDGGNHRTAFVVMVMFLKKNGKTLINRFDDAYEFLKDILNRSLEEVKEWIERGTA